jgi:DNA repair exonuclease SbcCD ATPase subunit
MSKKNYKSLYKGKKDENEMLKGDNEILRNYVSSMYSANVKLDRQRTTEIMEAQRLLALVPSLNNQISVQNAEINTLRKALASAGSCSTKEKEIDDLKEKIKQCEEGKKKCEEEKKKLQIELNELLAAKQALEDEMKALESDEEKKRLQLEQKLIDINFAKTAIEQQLAKCTQDKTQYEDDQKKLEDRVRALETENSDLKSQNQKLLEKFAEQTKQIEANVTELEEAKLKLTQEKTRFEQEIKICQQVITDLKKDVVSATAENTKLNNDLNVVNRRIKELETEIATLTQQIKDKDAEIIVLSSLLDAATQARDECKVAKTLIENKNKELALEITQLNQQIDGLKTNLASNTTTNKQESIELNKKITDLTNELRKSILKNWINDHIEVDTQQAKIFQGIIIPIQQFNDFSTFKYSQYTDYHKYEEYFKSDGKTTTDVVKKSLIELGFTHDPSRGSDPERFKAPKDKMSPIMQKLIKEKEEFAKLYKDNEVLLNRCAQEKDDCQKATTLCEENKDKINTRLKYLLVIHWIQTNKEFDVNGSVLITEDDQNSIQVALKDYFKSVDEVKIFLQNKLSGQLRGGNFVTSNKIKLKYTNITNILNQDGSSSSSSTPVPSLNNIYLSKFSLPDKDIFSGILSEANGEFKIVPKNILTLQQQKAEIEKQLKRVLVLHWIRTNLEFTPLGEVTITYSDWENFLKQYEYEKKDIFIFEKILKDEGFTQVPSSTQVTSSNTNSFDYKSPINYTQSNIDAVKSKQNLSTTKFINILTEKRKVWPFMPINLQNERQLKESLSATNDALTRQINETLNPEIARLTTENNEIPILNKKILELEGNLKPLSLENQELQRKLDALQSQFDALKTLQETTQDKLDECESTKQQDLIVKEEEIASLKAQLVKLETEKKEEKNRLDTQISNLSTEITSLNTEITSLKSKNEVFLSFIRDFIVGNYIVTKLRTNVQTTTVASVKQAHIDNKSLISRIFNNDGNVVIESFKNYGFTVTSRQLTAALDNNEIFNILHTKYFLTTTSPLISVMKGGKNLKILLKYNI